jgi:hypothetical protein
VYHFDAMLLTTSFKGLVLLLILCILIHINKDVILSLLLCIKLIIMASAGVRALDVHAH